MRQEDEIGEAGGRLLPLSSLRQKLSASLNYDLRLTAAVSPVTGAPNVLAECCLAEGIFSEFLNVMWTAAPRRLSFHWSGRTGQGVHYHCE